ncbi:ArsR/SmtB family transcription factor [Alkalibacter saccharofermentans]|uniref:ArsR family transcriptional regulator n=1 Tax=Alkalibacter saccharofermentans DSM 14828 TaxID=1120975 RepID=A0A1M4UQI5_9FIRM|nr:metalloregulator ArsR/SmtB family transcription factor [Alkalibacter saccharofermentans]SHE59012.1 ArsR family transcriptional regulator [Alkalibacter saccharofermentans DSM 14828]
MNAMTNIFKILSDETRLRILLLLNSKTLCVCQLQAIMDETQPKISKNLGRLRDLGLVTVTKQEKLSFYSLDTSNIGLTDILNITFDNLKSDETIMNDIERLNDVDRYIQVKDFAN